jgi:hypothetical protein
MIDVAFACSRVFAVKQVIEMPQSFFVRGSPIDLRSISGALCAAPRSRRRRLGGKPLARVRFSSGSPFLCGRGFRRSNRQSSRLFGVLQYVPRYVPRNYCVPLPVCATGEVCRFRTLSYPLASFPGVTRWGDTRLKALRQSLGGNLSEIAELALSAAWEGSLMIVRRGSSIRWFTPSGKR